MNTIKGNVVDLVKKEVYPGEIFFNKQGIWKIKRLTKAIYERYVLPGLVDSHVHIESSMLVPARFAEAALRHGTIATVSDPHEIANVLGKEGVRFMIDNGASVPFKFYFGAPSCVPATPFESSGAIIDSDSVKEMLGWADIRYLSEMMNFPGVINKDPEIQKKLTYAKLQNNPIDGHAPGLKGQELKSYVKAGIRTDHECYSLAEAREKLDLGMIVQIREGSAARNFDALYSLIDSHPDQVMLCSDDLHPDQLIKGHINMMIKKALSKKVDFFNVLRAATLNPVKFYGLDVGLLQEGDPSDFIVIDDLQSFNILETFIQGVKVYDGSSVLFKVKSDKSPNRYFKNFVQPSDLEIRESLNNIRIIEALDGELITNQILDKPKSISGCFVSDVEKDILKIVVLNRYEKEKPSVGFIRNFGLKYGGMISTIAHDSHNIICLGTNDTVICQLIEWVHNNSGGIAFSDGNEIWGIPLPVAGIISNAPAYTLAEKYHQLETMVKAAGSKLKAPFMTLSFMSLLVIPQLKLGNKGLFDVNSFNFVNLYTE